MRAAIVVVLSLLPLFAACTADNQAPHDTETDSSSDSAVDSDVADEPDSKNDTAEDSGPVCPPTDPACYFGFDLEGECCDERIWSARVPGQLGTAVDPALVRGCPVRAERAMQLPARVYDAICDSGEGVYRFCADVWPDFAEASPWGFIVFLAAGAGYETPVPEGCTTPPPTCRFGEGWGGCCEDAWEASPTMMTRIHGDSLDRLGQMHCPCVGWERSWGWTTCVAGWPDSTFHSTYFAMCREQPGPDTAPQWGVSVGAPEPPQQGEPPCNLFQIIEASGVRE